MIQIHLIFELLKMTEFANRALMTHKSIEQYSRQIQAAIHRRQSDEKIKKMAHKVSAAAFTKPGMKPVIFFNASTRLGGLSLNAAFSLLTSWGLRLQGVSVVHFICQRGMSRCVLGANRDDVSQPLPCDKCIRHSHAEYDRANTYWFGYQEEVPLRNLIQGLDVDALMKVRYQDIPIGEIVLPALRWELRRHHLRNDEPTCFLYREFILSAWNVGREFTLLLNQVDPQAVVLFNGQFFPEAVVRYLARLKGIRVISHEVGMMPFSAFFTEGEATAYPMDIPDEFQLNEDQNLRLDNYLANRFQGNFKMAGIQFWHGMKRLDEDLIHKITKFKQVVPIFTNVIFDTSQPHSNVLFPDMFTWLDGLLKVIKDHPDTLFIIRAHPDELRPGSAKQSRETVRDWVKENQVLDLDNIHFVDATEYLSSYELIQKSKFVMVYNSSIGLEASILGLPVLAAGRSRYTKYPTVYFPDTAEKYWRMLNEFLGQESIWVLPEHRLQARRVLYYQLFRTAIPFGAYLTDAHRPGLVTLRDFDLPDLLIENSPTMQALTGGIINGTAFVVDEE